MSDRETDLLFGKARAAMTPTPADRRRVRARVASTLGAASGVAAGGAGLKSAAAFGTSLSKAAGAGAAAASVATGGAAALATKALAVVAMVALAVGVAVPVLRHSSLGSSEADHATPVALSPAVPLEGAGRGPAHASEPASAPKAVAQPPPAPAPLAASTPRGVSLDGTPAATPPPGLHRDASPAATPPPPGLHRDASPAATPPPPGVHGEALPAARPPGDRNLTPAASLQAGPNLDEIRLIVGMQSALRIHDVARVLGLVAEHEQRFPTGSLAEEREGARVLARCEQAPRSDARSLGAAFLAEHPRSPLLGRVRALCGVGETP